MDDFMPIRYVEPGQDTQRLQKVARDVGRILTPNEEILDIALQNSTALSIKNDSVAITANRIIWVQSRNPGTSQLP